MVANQGKYYPSFEGDAELRNVDISGTLTVAGASVPVVASATVAFTDTTAKALFTIPAGAIITGWTINVTEAFDSSGTDSLDIGIDGTPDKFAADVDVSTTGLKTSGIVAAQIGVVQATAQAIEGIYTAGGSAATQGSALIIVNYYVPAS